MIFTQTRLKGAFIIEIEKLKDERGFFARSWDKNIFEEHGLNSNLVQCSISFNKSKGTLRGMHYQIYPHEEDKLVRCVRGKAFEVIIDLRPESTTYLQWESFEASSENYRMLYVPKGFAFGFQTLEENTEIFYQIMELYAPEFARGILWNDKVFNISWPLNPTIISKRDLSFKPFMKV
jgi:dTDP-4-dehydrorhamnose 3,5-epimerase